MIDLEGRSGRSRRGPQMSATPESTLANPEQRIADLERQLAEALERETATAEVLQVINSSPGELAPVFDAMLERAMRLCDAVYGHLFTYDGQYLHPAAVHGEPRYAEWMRRLGPFLPPTDTPVGEAVRGQAVVNVADVRDLSCYNTNPLFREQVNVGGFRSVLVVALSKEQRLLGTLTVFRQEVRPFTDKQIALLQNFAAQAVIAMDNARLITETREALEQQTATAEVLQVINSSPGDLAPVFDAMLDKAMALSGASFGGLSTYDGERFCAVGTRGVPSALSEFFCRPYSVSPQSYFGKIVSGEVVLHVEDLAAESSPSPPGLTRAGVGRGRAFVELGNARTALFLALRKEGTLLGILWFYRQEVRLFTDKQIALLENFAAQAVIAMENARLLGELRQRTEEVAELNRGLEARVAEQVDELGRVGRLKRFLAPQLAELIVSQGDEEILESHRRDIVVVFCDLRGYTAFTETAEPEEVLEFLREYHGALGPLVAEFEGTLDQFSGDGIMVFFNDPVPCPDPAERAVKMAVAMREA